MRAGKEPSLSLSERIRAGSQPRPATAPAPIDPPLSAVVPHRFPHGPDAFAAWRMRCITNTLAWATHAQAPFSRYLAAPLWDR